MDIQNTLEKVAKQGLNASSGDEMLLLACAYWHENFTPDLTRIKLLADREQHVIGYLTQFFSTFNCITDVRTTKLSATANIIRSWTNPTVAKDNFDDIAAEWGLSESISIFLGDILFFQTRHYEHTPWSC